MGGIADARGMAVGDFDHDGDVDIVVNNYNAKASFYENRMADGNNWLAVRLHGTKANRDGVGAQVIASVGKRTVYRLVGSYAYSGQYSLEQIIGLGEGDAVSGLSVRWPDGTLEQFGAFDANQRVILRQGQGSVVENPAPLSVKSRSWIWLLGFPCAFLVAFVVMLRRRG